MPLTELHIKAPNKHKMGPDAKGGTADTTGAKGIANKKQRPVTKGARPPGECIFSISGVWVPKNFGVYPKQTGSHIESGEFCSKISLHHQRGPHTGGIHLSWHHPQHPQYFPQRWRPWRRPRWNQRVQQWHPPNRPQFFHVLFWWRKPWVFPWRIPEIGWKYLEICRTKYMM